MENIVKSKRGNVNQLTAIGWGLVMFGITIGLGVTVLSKFGDQVVSCAGADLEGTVTWDSVAQLCTNGTDTVAGSGDGYSAISYVVTQMGSTGLAGWIPLIIVVVVAGLIFAYFGMRGRNY